MRNSGWMKGGYSFLLILALPFLADFPLVAGENDMLCVGEFSRNQMDGWAVKIFDKKTTYQLAMVENKTALKAVSHSSASGLVKKIRIDLEKFPFINWRWRIESRLDGIFNEKQKGGDDYAARIYVIASGGLAIWNTRVLNYVWAKHALKENTWFNAYAGKKAVMTAVRSSKATVSIWYNEKRNIQKDFEKYFNKKIKYIDAVALMSDTDNTQNRVTAYYGDIYFSAR